jgi:hypothetical protein
MGWAWWSRCHTAIASASWTSWVVIVVAIAQPRMRWENTSTTKEV